jgi:hypothetical protein
VTDHTGAVRAAFANIDLDLANPVHAFAYGWALGAAAERESQDLADDLVHRTAVRAAIVHIEHADRRAAADRPGPRQGDYEGRAA